MSITKQQILEADNKELPDLIGQVLNPDAYEWDKNGISHKIYLNWDNAMKWRDWAVKEYGVKYHTALRDVYIAEQGYCIHMGLDDWLSLAAKPEHYLKASAICKIGAKK